MPTQLGTRFCYKVFIISTLEKNVNQVLVLVLPIISLAVFNPVFAETFHVSIPEGTSNEGCETTNECYIPFEIKINTGDTVVWTNNDIAFHTVTSGKPESGPDGNFDSGMFKTDEQFSHKFEEPGNFDYFCMLHPWMKASVTVQKPPRDENGGGCLIATATYGTELAPQIQKLREVRDGKLLQTESGRKFIQTFNDIYYSFSPTIADYQRENPAFKEAVKIAITPMISSLSILNHVEFDSEEEVLGYGTSLILLNLGMYVGVPLAAFITIKRQRFSSSHQRG